MAITDIQATVLANTGNTPTANSVEDAQRYVVSSIPKDLLKWASSETTAGSHGGDSSTTAITLPVGTDNIVSVRREGYAAEEVPIKDRGFIGNSASLKLATSVFPKYFKQSGNAIVVKPNPTDSATAHVTYVDYSKLDDTSDLRNAVINYTTSKEFSRLAADNLPSWSSILPPVAPSLSSNSVSFSETAPSYIKPTLSLTTFPTLDWTLPSKPVAPVINASTSSTGGAEVDTNKLATAPTYTPPVMQSPDWSDVENWITTEEDSEMLSSRVQAIQSQISEYQAKLNESKSKFEKENIEYQAKLQIALQDASQANSGDSLLINQFNSDIQVYQAEVNSIIQNNSNQVQEWQQENSLKLQKYNSDIQNELNQFNKDNVKYQVELQISIQNAQLEDSGDAQKLQKYSQELQDYQLTINKKANEVQNITHYERESEKYYKWAQNEIQQYIQNNSQVIAATLAAQTSQRR
jgi:hypothetical protein